MTLPGTIPAMLENLMYQYQQPIEIIAKQMGVSVITVRRLLAGNKPSRHTHMQLIRFYCQVCV